MEFSFLCKALEGLGCRIIGTRTKYPTTHEHRFSTECEGIDTSTDL